MNSPGLRTSLALLAAVAALMGGDTRLTNDNSGYISAYTLATGIPWTDTVLNECSVAHGRQNEPAVAVNPRDSRVLIGSSNDYCGVYAGSTAPTGPVWLGYYRSENRGATFQSSLVPGYPGDTSPYASLAHVRTAGAGDPVIAWDRHGRVFLGSESSGDPDGTRKTFGDVWVATYENPGGENSNTLNDGKEFTGSVVVAKGSSAPNLLGKFHDKTAIEADRTGTCDGNVYFAWSRFTGNSGNNNIYFARSTDHGRTWSTPMLLTPSTQSVQGPDIAVTGNGHIYITYRQYETRSGQLTAIGVVKSTDCGRTFSPPGIVTTILPNDAEDRLISGGVARDCGDFSNACQSGYTFFRRDTLPRSAADQNDTAHEWIYTAYEGSKLPVVDTGTTYGTLGSGRSAQSGVYFVRYDGASGTHTAPALIDNQPRGHQIFPDISAEGGVLHAVWWDSRNDPDYSAGRPIGNSATGVTGPSLDVWSARSLNGGATWNVSGSPLNAVTSNPNYEQFSDRTVPFAGDYLWITSLGEFAYAAWTDWRDTRPGVDPRQPASTDGADVWQCRTQSASGVWSGDQCPHAGGLDQNIYGAQAP